MHIPHRQSECAAHPARFPAAHPLPRPHRSIHRRAYSKQSRVRRGECCPRPRVRLECGRPRRRHRRQTQDPTVSRDQSAGVWGMHMHERRQLLSVCVLTRTGHLPYTLALPSCPHRPRFTLYGRPSRWVVGIGRPTPERQAYSGKAGLLRKGRAYSGRACGGVPAQSAAGPVCVQMHRSAHLEERRARGGGGLGRDRVRVRHSRQIGCNVEAQLGAVLRGRRRERRRERRGRGRWLRRRGGGRRRWRG